MLRHRAFLNMAKHPGPSILITLFVLALSQTFLPVPTHLHLHHALTKMMLGSYVTMVGTRQGLYLFIGLEFWMQFVMSVGVCLWVCTCNVSV